MFAGEQTLSACSLGDGAYRAKMLLWMLENWERSSGLPTSARTFLWPATVSITLPGRGLNPAVCIMGLVVVAAVEGAAEVITVAVRVANGPLVVFARVEAALKFPYSECCCCCPDADAFVFLLPAMKGLSS